MWAVSCVMTRQNRVPTRKSGDQVLVMIPFWDMANHALGKARRKLKHGYFYV